MAFLKCIYVRLCWSRFKQPTLENGGIDVNEDNGDDGANPELVLPRIGVNFSHGTSESKKENDKD